MKTYEIVTVASEWTTDEHTETSLVNCRALKITESGDLLILDDNNEIKMAYSAKAWLSAKLLV